MVRKKYKLIVLVAMIVIMAMALIFGIGSLTAFANESSSGHKWQIVPIEELIITTEGGAAIATDRIELHLGETVKLNVVLNPDYAIYTAGKPQYEIINGTNLAKIDNNEGVLTVNADADKHVGAEVRVIAVVDGVTSKNALTFDIIKTPIEIETDVEWIDIIPILSTVNEEQEYAISELLQTYIVGNNVEEPEYEQYGYKRNTFVRIDNVKGTLCIDPGSDLDHRFFYLQATVEGVTSNYLRFEIYVKTKTLDADLVNELPMSSSKKGDTVLINIKVDERATTQMPEIRIVEGWNLIAGNYNCGDLVENQFDLKANAASLGEKFILIEVSQDGLSDTVSIEVYIPVEEVSFNNRSINIDGKIYYYIDRLDTNILSPVFTPNAYLTGKEDWEVSNKGIANVFDLYQIKIPQSTPAGTKIAVTYQSKDLLHTEFTSYFIVEEFSEDVIKNKLSVAYGYDSGDNDGNKVKIDPNEPQLWVGRSAEILITIFGNSSLSDFGLSVSDKDLFKNSTAETGKKNDNEAWIKIEPGASGKDVISNAYIIIKDGNETYKIMLPELNVFKPLGGTPELEGAKTAMTEKTKDFKLIGGTGWVYDATYGLDDLVIIPSDLNYATFLNNRLTITSEYVSASLIFTVSCTQNYNGTEKLFLDSNGESFTVTQSIKRIALKVNGTNIISSGTTSILAVDGFCRTITTPRRTGYDFTGYYRYSSGTGTLYYNKDGIFVGEHSNSPYLNCEGELYAGWSQKSLTVYACYEPNPGSGNYYYDRLQSIYVNYGSNDSSVSVEAPTISGYIFKEWRKHSRFWEYLTSQSYSDYFIRDPSFKELGKYENSVTTTNRKTINLSDLGVKEGITIFVAYYEVDYGDACVAEGTLITLADGTQKPVEQLNGNELLLVWNLHTGKFDVAPIIFIDSGHLMEHEIIQLHFSDGTKVKVINEHAFWDFDLNQYVFLRSDAAQYIGHWFNKQITDENGEISWTRVQLTDVEIYKEYTTAWSPVTFGHLCFYVNGMLSMPGSTEGLINIFEVNGETMQIDQEKFQKDIETYGLLPYEYFEDLIPEIMYEAFQAQYLSISLAKGLITEEGIIKLIERYSKFLFAGEDSL